MKPNQKVNSKYKGEHDSEQTICMLNHDSLMIWLRIRYVLTVCDEIGLSHENHAWYLFQGKVLD